MSNVKAMPFRIAHLDIIDLREHERKLLNMDMLQALSAIGQCLTLIYDGRILGVVGYVEKWAGVFDVFVIPGKYIERYALVYARKVKQYVERLKETFDIHRMQTASLASTSNATP